MINNLLKVLFILCISFLNGQIGINTQTPNNNTILDIESNKKGILIPRLTTEERNTNLEDNNIDTPVSNKTLQIGTLIFNTTTKSFQFWDGSLWKDFRAENNNFVGNDGVVRINSNNDGSKPNFNLESNGNSWGNELKIIYSTPLIFANSPTTSWPENTPNVEDKTQYIYQNGLFKENNVHGQVHIWRLIVNVQANSNSAGTMMAKLRSKITEFEVNSIQLIPSGSKDSNNKLTFYFYTIADGNSIGDGKGYELYLQANTSISGSIESFTRVSLFKD